MTVIKTFYLPHCLFLQHLGFVGFFPGEVEVVPPEVTVGSRLSEDGAAQVKVSDNGSGSEVEVFVYQS